MIHNTLSEGSHKHLTNSTPEMADTMNPIVSSDQSHNHQTNSAPTNSATTDPILSAQRGDVDFFEAAQRGDVDFFEAIEVDVIKSLRDEWGNTVLSTASAYGHLNCCQVIYRRCPELLYSSKIPLHRAADAGQNEIIKFLLSAGVTREDIETEERGDQAVDYRLLMMVDEDKETALHCAARSRKFQSVKLLLEADHNNELLRRVNNSNKTAMHIAVERRCFEIVKLLAETDPDFIYLPDAYFGETPLDKAARESFSGDGTAVAIRKILIEKLSNQCKLPIGEKGWTLLHHAASEGDLGSVEDIIHFRPECRGLVDNERKNFLHLATESGHEGIVKYTMGLTNIDDNVLNGQDIHGNTPLHIATSRGYIGVGLALLYNPKVKKLVLNNQGRTALDAITFEYDKKRAGVDPMVCAQRGDVDFFEAMAVDDIKNSRDHIGDSVLSTASAYGHLNCCQVIYRRCPELLYHNNNQGNTALHDAAYNGENEIIKFLLSTGVTHADIETGERGDRAVNYRLLMMVNVSNETALHLAAVRGKFHSTKLLLEADHNNELLSRVNNSNQTAMHIAVEKHYFEIVTLLAETYPDFIYPPDASGQTPLYKALQESFSADVIAVAIWKILIEKFSSQCKLPTGPRQWTLLHHAANKGDLSCIEDIIRFSPECLPLVDSELQNFLHLATKLGHERIVRYAMGSPKIDDSVLNGKDIDGNTPLHIATSRGHAGIGLAFLYNPKVEKFVLNKYGRNALEAINFSYDKRKAGVFGSIQALDEKDVKDRSDFDLVVGALISTVSFTAGITVPGGFFSDGPYQGNAVLHKKRSFEAFVVSNTIALLLSLYAVFCHFCTRRLIIEASITYQLTVATYCSLGSIFAMVVAFITGSCAVLAISDELAITVCVLCCCFFGFSFRAMWRMIREQQQRQRPSRGGENCLSFLGLGN